MSEIQIFNKDGFGNVRTIEEDGKILFVATDIAKALGYANPHDAINKHCRWVAKREVPHPQSKTKTMEVNVIPEGDIYRLVANSELESAEKFESWVFDEVIPSIRKNGIYSGQKTLSALEQIRLQNQALIEVDEKVDNLASDLEQFKQEMPLLGVDMDEITHAVHVRGVNALGGKDSLAYQSKSIRQQVYQDIYRQLKYQFNVKSYKALARNQLKHALAIVDEYELPVFLQDMITCANNQMRIEG